MTNKDNTILGSLSTRDFKTGTAHGSELFSLITYLHTTTFALLSTFSPLGMISIKIWETPLSWHSKCSFPVAVRVSKTGVLKLPISFAQLQESNIELEKRSVLSLTLYFLFSIHLFSVAIIIIVQ